MTCKEGNNCRGITKPDGSCSCAEPATGWEYLENTIVEQGALNMQKEIDDMILNSMNASGIINTAALAEEKLIEYDSLEMKITENGFVITEPEGKEFVFTTMNKLRKWLEEHLASTAEVKEFTNNL